MLVKCFDLDRVCYTARLSLLPYQLLLGASWIARVQRGSVISMNAILSVCLTRMNLLDAEFSVNIHGEIAHVRQIEDSKE